MADHRLLEAFTQFDPEQIQRVFGSEHAFNTVDPSLARAPVKRVAIIAEAFLPKVDGVSKSAFLTLRYLQQTGREVLVFAPDTAPPAVGSTQVIPLPSLGVPNVPETRVGLPSLRVVNEIADFRPDIIHLFSPAFLSVSGMLTGRLLNIPVIANYQTDLPGYSHEYGVQLLTHVAREWLRYIHNGCHLTLAPSHFTLNQLREWGFHRLRIWGRGVNGQRFSPDFRTSAWRERLLNGRDPNSLVCIYVGRLAPEKRVDLLLDVARTPGVALTIIGDGPLREELETLFEGTDTYFMGYQYGDDLSHAFASADVFAFTGTRETFGQVVQEAMASGLPCVVINQGGVIDLVIEGETGYICPDDPAAFAQAVRNLYENPALREQMGFQARLIALQHPWEVIMDQLEDHYIEALRINQRLIRIYGQEPTMLSSLFQRYH
ncbi:MAG: glycosyltransferase family 1 protein [Anaerolineae bacterium]|nr:glycosyltransferase family 1 protein [Anaerolineae bacterium]